MPCNCGSKRFTKTAAATPVGQQAASIPAPETPTVKTYALPKINSPIVIPATPIPT